MENKWLLNMVFNTGKFRKSNQIGSHISDPTGEATDPIRIIMEQQQQQLVNAAAPGLQVKRTCVPILSKLLSRSKLPRCTLHIGKGRGGGGTHKKRLICNVPFRPLAYLDTCAKYLKCLEKWHKVNYFPKLDCNLYAVAGQRNLNVLQGTV